MQTEQTGFTIVCTAMDVYLFDLEHLAPGARGLDCERHPGDFAEPYDLAELNRLVGLDIARRAGLN